MKWSTSWFEPLKNLVKFDIIAPNFEVNMTKKHWNYHLLWVNHKENAGPTTNMTISLTLTKATTGTLCSSRSGTKSRSSQISKLQTKPAASEGTVDGSEIRRLHQLRER